jgi:hypothetical protein
MAILDSQKITVAAKYGASAANTDVVPISNEEVRLPPNVASGSYKCLGGGKLGNSNVWTNTDDTTVEGAEITGFVLGNDATGTALATLPKWAEIYKICALNPVIVASKSVTYSPLQTAISNASTVKVWRDGFRRILSGAIGTLTINGTIGEPLMQTASIYGFTDIVSAAEANPVAACADGALILVLKSIDTLTIKGTAYKAKSFVLTQGNDIQKLYAIGLKTYERVDFASTLQITYFKENETIYTDFAANTKVEVLIKAGSVSGKVFKLTCSNAQVQGIEEGSEQGKETVTVTFNLQGDATGENQFKFAFGEL